MKQLKTGKTYQDAKLTLYSEQDHKCPLCGHELSSDMKNNHLDHDHSLDGVNAGKVRGLLCSGCNRVEGKIMNWMKRLGLVNRNVDIPLFLRNLSVYIESDYSKNDFHPQYISDIIARFKRLSLQEMKSEMITRGYEYSESDKKSDLVKKFSKQFRKEQHSL